MTLRSDWLNAAPVFYNERTGAQSRRFEDVVDYERFEWDPEGLNDYLDFGYAVFGRTPVRDVRFLPPNASLERDDAGALVLRRHPDPAEEFAGKTIDENEAIERMREAVRAWERRARGDIVIPTSGGYDSRLLNHFVEDTSRVRSFTYGVSRDQSRSLEAARARVLAERLGAKWERVPIGDYHLEIGWWEDRFGLSTHAHGMYHVEFYRNIIERGFGGAPLLSGVIGDVWAGNVNIPDRITLDNVRDLGYTHGVHADAARSRFPQTLDNRARYLEENRERLGSRYWRIVEANRLKIMLLRYLVEVPRELGFAPWSPFLEPDVAGAMLAVPDERWRDRRWQTDYLARVGLDLENERIPHTRQDTLDLDAARRVPLEPLDADLLSEIVDRDYVERANAVLVSRSALRRFYHRLHFTPLVKGALKTAGFRNRFYDAYFVYIVLHPLLRAIKKRDAIAAGREEAR